MQWKVEVQPGEIVNESWTVWKKWFAWHIVSDGYFNYWLCFVERRHRRCKGQILPDRTFIQRQYRQLK